MFNGESYLAAPMLFLNNIALTHYKNYDIRRFDFGADVIGIAGLNGVGKTNLLDAIFYTSFTKSYFTSNDAQNVHTGSEGFRLQAEYKREGKQEKVVCIYRGAGKKEFSLNDIPYNKFSEHIGYLPIVMVAPDDSELITGSSDLRRRFIDTLISQLNPDYLQQLIRYNKLLSQRNSLLKAYNQQQDASTLLNVLNAQMIPAAQYIFHQREYYLNSLVGQVNDFYHDISGGVEKIGIEYVSQLRKHSLEELFERTLQQDIYLQRTTTGIHKDELAFTFDRNIFRQVASQGQRKSLLFSLKLSEYKMINEKNGFAPLLLLDDVFEKLDHERMSNLLSWVGKCNGQVFITDTHRERLEKTFNEAGLNAQIIGL